MLTQDGNLEMQWKSNGNLRTQQLNNNGNVGGITMDGNTWTHIALRIQRLQSQGNSQGRAHYLELRVNGVNGGTHTTDNTTSGGNVAENILAEIEQDFIFGLQRTDQSSTQFIGLIDEISIFNERLVTSSVNQSTLSSSDIVDLYNEGYGMYDIVSHFNGAFELPYYFQLNDGSGNSGTNSGSSSSTSQLGGGASWVTE